MDRKLPLLGIGTCVCLGPSALSFLIINGFVLRHRSGDPVFLGYSKMALLLNLFLMAVFLFICTIIAQVIAGKFVKLPLVLEKTTALLSRPWRALFCTVLLVQMNFALYFLLFLRHLLPATVAFVCFCLNFGPVLGVLFLHWKPIGSWIDRNKEIWASISLTLCAFLFLLGVFEANTLWYGPYAEFLSRISTPHTPSSLVDKDIDIYEFWDEERSDARSSRWLPLLYWRQTAVEGKYINIDSRGLRATENRILKSDRAVKQVFVFGGSTVWGTGARDEYTIPSVLSRLLTDDHEQNVRVTNFGEVGYVSTQDLILFMRQLQLGNIPDVAVFYQGYNDVMAIPASGYAGIPHNEYNRVQDFNLGRVLHSKAFRSGNDPAGLPFNPFAVLSALLKYQVFEQTLNQAAPDLDIRLVSKGGSSEDIIEMYLENVRVIQLLCTDYNVQPLFVWQPVLYYADKPLTEAEAGVIQNVEKIAPGITRIYIDTDTEWRRQIEKRTTDAFLDLAHLFQDESELLFIDDVHLVEKGNIEVARAIAPVVADMLSKH